MAEVGQGFDCSSGGDVIVAHNTNMDINPPGFTAEFWMEGIKNQDAIATVFEKSHGAVDSTGWAFQCLNSNGYCSSVVGAGGGGAGDFVGVDSLIDILDVERSRSAAALMR